MSMWQKKGLRPILYVRYFNKKYGKGVWEDFIPQTLWMDIKEETGQEPAQHIKDKVNALKVLKTSESFFTDPNIFEKIILAFNDSFVDVESIQTCSPEEMAYGIPVAEEVVGKKEYDDDVVRYVQACCEEWGLIVYPTSLRFAQRSFDKDSLSYHVYQDVTSKRFNLNPSEWQKKMIENINTYVLDRLTKKGSDK